MQYQFNEESFYNYCLAIFNYCWQLLCVDYQVWKVNKFMTIHNWYDHYFSILETSAVFDWNHLVASSIGFYKCPWNETPFRWCLLKLCSKFFGPRCKIVVVPPQTPNLLKLCDKYFFHLHWLQNSLKLRKYARGSFARKRRATMRRITDKSRRDIFLFRHTRRLPPGSCSTWLTSCNQ